MDEKLRKYNQLNLSYDKKKVWQRILTRMLGGRYRKDEGDSQVVIVKPFTIRMWL